MGKLFADSIGQIVRTWRNGTKINRNDWKWKEYLLCFSSLSPQTKFERLNSQHGSWLMDTLYKLELQTSTSGNFHVECSNRLVASWQRKICVMLKMVLRKLGFFEFQEDMSDATFIMITAKSNTTSIQIWWENSYYPNIFVLCPSQEIYTSFLGGSAGKIRLLYIMEIVARILYVVERRKNKIERFSPKSWDPFEHSND